MSTHANRVNIHFENRLAGSQYLRGNFDFIYFLLNKDDIPLFSDIIFDTNYLSFLNNLGFKTNVTNCASSIKDWWVENESCSLTNKLNSKIFLQNYLRENEIFESDSFVVNTLEEINKFGPEYNLIREEYSVSGRGTYLRSQKQPTKLPVILTKLKKRICDIGAKVQDDQIQTYFNLVDRKFCFRGQFFDQNNLFKKKHNKIFQKLEIDAANLFNHIKNDFNVKNIQFDSFLYNDNGSLQLEFAHEINYRKSMGDVYYSLNERGIIRKNYVLLLYLIFPESLDFATVIKKLDTEIKKSGILTLSPMLRGLNLFLSKMII